MVRTVIMMCDDCGERSATGKWRVGDKASLFTLDLCDECSGPVDRLHALGRRLQPPRVKLEVSSMAKVRALATPTRRGRRTPSKASYPRPE